MNTNQITLTLLGITAPAHAPATTSRLRHLLGCTAPHEVEPGQSRAGQLIHVIEHAGPISTPQLAQRTGATTRQVWGLLKQPREAGRIDYYDGHWRISQRRDQRIVAAAAQALRDRGWTCTPPDEGPRA